MFKKIKNAAEYTVLAYTLVIATKGLAELAIDCVQEGMYQLKRRHNPDLTRQDLH